MKEQLESLASKLLSAWRFRWMAVGIAWVVMLVGSTAVLMMPSKFESNAQIYLDTRSVLRPLLEGLAVSPQTRDEAEAVSTALLARPALDEVARRAGLYRRARTPEARERLLTDLSKQISIKGDAALGIYNITYTDSSPAVAQSVVQDLLDAFVQKSLGAGRTDTQSAETFLKQQVAEYETALSQSEQRLADFKKKNVGLMPDQRGDYFARLQTELSTLQKTKSDLAIAQRQRDELMRKISGESNGKAVSLVPPSAQEIQAATALDARIRDSKHELDELLLKYTDKHPEVIALKDTIRRLEEQRRDQLGGVRATNGTATEGSTVPIDPVIQNLQIALNTADVQVAALEATAQQSEARVAELQRLVTTGPEVEADLARLNRDYGVTKSQYEALLQRLENARLSNDADRSAQRRFKVLESPRAPLRPISPNRMLLLIGVLLASLAIGAALALLRAFAYPVFFSKQDAAAATGLPVIGVITMARSVAGRRENFAFAAVTVMLVTTVVTIGIKSFAASQFLVKAMGWGST